MVAGMGEPVPLTEPEKVELKARGAKLHYRKALEYGKERKMGQRYCRAAMGARFHSY